MGLRGWGCEHGACTAAMISWTRAAALSRPCPKGGWGTPDMEHRAHVAHSSYGACGAQLVWGTWRTCDPRHTEDRHGAAWCMVASWCLACHTCRSCHMARATARRLASLIPCSGTVSQPRPRLSRGAGSAGGWEPGGWEQQCLAEEVEHLMQSLQGHRMRALGPGMPLQCCLNGAVCGCHGAGPQHPQPGLA